MLFYDLTGVGGKPGPQTGTEESLGEIRPSTMTRQVTMQHLVLALQARVLWPGWPASLPTAEFFTA